MAEMTINQLLPNTCRTSGGRERPRTASFLACLSLLACSAVLAVADASADTPPVDIEVGGMFSGTEHKLQSIEDDPVSGRRPVLWILAPFAGGLQVPSSEMFTGNTVRIETHNLNDAYSVYGGMSHDFDVVGNTLVVDVDSSSFAVQGSAFAGFTSDEGGSEVRGNALTIAEGFLFDIAGGGYSAGGKVSGNSVTVTGQGNFDTGYELVGGMARYGGVLEGNTVTIEDSDRSNPVYVSYLIGAYTSNSRAYGDLESRLTGNTVTVGKKGDHDDDPFFGLVKVANGVAGAALHGAPVTPDSRVTLISENEVTLKRGTYTASVYGAVVGFVLLYDEYPSAKVEGATISKNKVTIMGEVAVNGSIYGADASGEDSSGSNDFFHNSVTVEGYLAKADYGTRVMNVYGASGMSGTADCNSVSLTSVSAGGDFVVGGDVAGAFMKRAAIASGNTVRVWAEGTETAELYGFVFGALVNDESDESARDAADGNTVDIKGNVTIGLGIAGGAAYNGTANDNTVRFNGLSDTQLATVRDNVTGGEVRKALHIDSQSGASRNAVELGNVALGGYAVSGGQVSDSTDAPVLLEDNSVSLSGLISVTGSVAQVQGAVSHSWFSSSFSHNTVSIIGRVEDSGGTITDVYGAYGPSGSAAADRNGVYIETVGGDIALSGNVSGAYMSGSSAASGNSVLVRSEGQHSVEIGGSVTGAHVWDGSASAGDPDDPTPNEVRLLGRVSVSGDVFGASSEYGTADGSLVVIEGLSGSELAVAGGRVSGGFVEVGDADSSASGNTVRLKNVELRGSAYGGLVRSGPTGQVGGNTMILGGTILSSGPGIDLAGGRHGWGTPVGFAGNTLVLEEDFRQEGNGFESISGFENIVIYASSSRALSSVADSDPLLKANGTLTLTDGTSNSRFSLVMTDDAVLPAGFSVLLTEADIVETSPSADPVTVEIVSAGIIMYETPVAFEGGTIVLTVEAAGLKDQAKALSELPLADVSFVNRGGDLLASQGIPAALSSTGGTPGLAPFAAVSYGRYSMETGSHVDVKGMTGAVGVAFGTETSAGPFTAGVFIEFGDGSFESFNEFAGIPTVRGHGDLSFLGGGVFARLDFGTHESSHPYLEASFRFGKTDAEFRSDDIQGPQGQRAEYGFDAGYWGFHAGGGYVLAFGGGSGNGSGRPAGTLDFSAKYFHVRRDGHDFDMFGQKANLSSVTSSRIRLGARLELELSPSVRPYFGAYFEHELDGDSRVTYAGFPLPEASLGGSSAVGELGLAVSSPGSPLELQLGIQGSTGRREGISASLAVRYVF
ncbi:MAG: hypothetical protein LBT40_14655 [Deltaproteobacteria bacterium]|jgi:hypothetical protein|nr:hypothetical protein [Deltaproteobacteria bacterium]